jgi:hypothetical protein
MRRNKTASLDHLVRAQQQRLRDGEAELLRGLEVDHQLVLDRRLHRKVAWLRTLEDEIDINRRAPKIIGQVNSVGQEAAEFSEETVRIDGRKMVASRQRCDLYAMSIREAITIRPPFGSRACAATTDSSSELSRTDAAIASTAKDRAAALKGFRK